MNQRDLKSDQTRQEILNAAVALFAKNGFHSTTINQIVEVAHLTKGAFYGHFKNKEAIFRAVVEEVKNEWNRMITREIREEGNALKKLNKMLDVFVRLTLQKKEKYVIFIVLIAEFTEMEDRFESVLKEAFDEIYDHVAGGIEEGKRAQQIRTEIDSRLLAITLVGTWQGILLQWLLNRERVRLEDLVNALRCFLFGRVSAGTAGNGSS